MWRYLPVILAILLLSCKNKQESKQPIGSGIAVKDSSFMSLVPGTEKVDSIVILFYKDERYRYYTYFPTDSAALIKTLKANLKTAKSALSNCRKEGTIYLYVDGKIFNTLYFNVSPGCEYLSFIFNGSVRRYEISTSLISALREINPISIQPG